LTNDISFLQIICKEKEKEKKKEKEKEKKRKEGIKEWKQKPHAITVA
jgi:ribosomal protein S2